jgi:hypothetical protein
VAAKQWAVGRAFNRLVKMAFDKEGIASRDPTQIVILDTPAAVEEPVPADDTARRRRLA